MLCYKNLRGKVLRNRRVKNHKHNVYFGTLQQYIRTIYKICFTRLTWEIRKIIFLIINLWMHYIFNSFKTSYLNLIN